jgi:hypothetical protein
MPTKSQNLWSFQRASAACLQHESFAKNLPIFTGSFIDKQLASIGGQTFSSNDL